MLITNRGSKPLQEKKLKASFGGRLTIMVSALAAPLLLSLAGTGVVSAASSQLTLAQTTACFASHMQAAPLNLAEAEACAPSAPVVASGNPIPASGPAIVQQTDGYYMVVYSVPESAPTGVAQATSGCSAIATQFATQDWWFGAAWGTYSPRGAWWYFPPDCYDWYSNMYTNGFGVTDCVDCSNFTYSEGTYDSNWANSHGYGYWATAWVNGSFSVIFPPNVYFFTCRASIYPNGSTTYAGCNLT